MGASQVLLRSQGPRGPVAIACPVSTPQSIAAVPGFVIVFVRYWGWAARGLKMAAEPLDETLSQV